MRLRRRLDYSGLFVLASTVSATREGFKRGIQAWAWPKDKLVLERAKDAEAKVSRNYDFDMIDETSQTVLLP